MNLSQPSLAVIIVAAGASTRFRKSLATEQSPKKVFALLNDLPVFLWSVKKLARFEPVRQIILVLSAEDRAMVEKNWGEELDRLKVERVNGGAQRSDSVANGFAQVRQEIDYVAIHDAARPCFTLQLVEKIFAAAITTGGAISASRLTGTIKREKKREDGLLEIEETVDRESLWEAQTPQIFRRDLYSRALEKRGERTPTDDASLFELASFPVALVEADRTNLKITTGTDLELARGILNEQS